MGKVVNMPYHTNTEGVEHKESTYASHFKWGNTLNMDNTKCRTMIIALGNNLP